MSPFTYGQQLNALTSNPPNAAIHITNGASDWLWAVFAIMLLTDLLFIAWSFTRPRGTRVYHQIAIIILTTATIAYFSMASDLGATPVTAQSARWGGGTRQIWYVRYIQWFITAPLLLLLLFFPVGLAAFDILTTLFMIEVTVVCGLAGALVTSGYKWGFYALGVAALFYVWWEMHRGPSTVFGNSSNNNSLRSTHLPSASFLSLLLLFYPICWGLSEGSNTIRPTSEMIFYGILDLLAGPLWLLWHVWRLGSVGAGAGYGGYGHGFGAGSGSGYGGGYGGKDGMRTAGTAPAAGTGTAAGPAVA